MILNKSFIQVEVNNIKLKEKIMCDLCPRYCKLSKDQVGFCGARKNKNGKIESISYGKIVALDLDPIEKKPLSFFHQGSYILSAGTFGCNMDCAFCQNFHLARAGVDDILSYEISPKDLAEKAKNLQDRGNIGLAFTYNEPTINFEYVRDTFKLVKKLGMETVLISNGQINDPYLEEILPLTSGWNIDLKTFSKSNYRKLGGDLDTCLNTIKKVAKSSHLEITTLVVPGISDDLDDFKKEVDFLSDLDPNIPLHLSRYFPSYKYGKDPTPINLMEEMKKIAQEKLNYVVLGNVW